MKLFWSQGCPYSRIARIAAIESGLQSEINFVKLTNFHPSPERPLQESLLFGAPVLQLNSGITLHDCRVICECLNDFGSGTLIPSDVPKRWRVLSRQAAGLHLLELGTSLQACIEHNRLHFAALQRDAIEVALSYLSSTCELDGSFTVADIAIICGLAFLGDELRDSSWDSRCSRLADWFEQSQKRPSIAATEANEIG